MFFIFLREHWHNRWGDWLIFEGFWVIMETMNVTCWLIEHAFATKMENISVLSFWPSSEFWALKRYDFNCTKLYALIRVNLNNVGEAQFAANFADFGVCYNPNRFVHLFQSFDVTMLGTSPADHNCGKLVLGYIFSSQRSDCVISEPRVNQNRPWTSS